MRENMMIREVKDTCTHYTPHLQCLHRKDNLANSEPVIAGSFAGSELSPDEPPVLHLQIPAFTEPDIVECPLSDIFATVGSSEQTNVRTYVLSKINAITGKLLNGTNRLKKD